MHITEIKSYVYACILPYFSGIKQSSSGISKWKGMHKTQYTNLIFNTKTVKII